MKKEDCFNLGIITKTFGKNGEVIFFLDVDHPENYNDLEMVFIEINQKLIPFFIETIKIKGNYATVKLEDISNPEKAQKFLKLNLFLPIDFLPDLPDEKFYFHEIIGFSVEDEDHGDIGIINDILELPEQSLLQILFKEKEILVPIVDEIVKSVDSDNKKVYINAPQGLIDLYL
ncbi:MAG: 16S rRNA processing protein RimM [Bacteroidales bacterium]|nr:16S rRNA processing protein RimM [Bacteroidales bacterium]